MPVSFQFRAGREEVDEVISISSDEEEPTSGGTKKTKGKEKALTGYEDKLTSQNGVCLSCSFPTGHFLIAFIREPVESTTAQIQMTKLLRPRVNLAASELRYKR